MYSLFSLAVSALPIKVPAMSGSEDPLLTNKHVFICLERERGMGYQLSIIENFCPLSLPSVYNTYMILLQLVH